ncbi:hypothetical protein Y958_15465 [Nitrospirillum viridazoti CBAmc]|uniref:DUF4175 domain-containing protein n=1 Tax=Nitrospirillum viridazoti CBAmc TaxID=1441467 RepID=A0A248JV03_9PROT|nr:hypothetical protein Y958_15465 [Nitrospirillum amazonense CBAmc]
MERIQRTWRWPALLAILTLIGLLSALLGQGGIWWLLSWTSLAAPLGVIIWKGRVLWFTGRAR